MTITLPRWARATIYIVTIVVTPLVAYLRARDIIGDLEVQLWAAEVAAAGTVATLNLSAGPTSITGTVTQISDGTGLVDATLDRDPVSPAD